MPRERFFNLLQFIRSKLERLERQPIVEGTSSNAVSLKYKYRIFVEIFGKLAIHEQPERSMVLSDFKSCKFSGRKQSRLQSFLFNATSPLSRPIDLGICSTAVSLKFKYMIFSAIPGYIVRFEQPERFRDLRDLNLMPLLKLTRLVQHLLF